MESLANRYERNSPYGQNQEHAAQELRKWVDGRMAEIQQQLDAGVNPEFDAPDGWFKATVSFGLRFDLRNNGLRTHKAALEHELRAQGWNAVKYEFTPVGQFYSLWSLRSPLIVVPVESVPFHASIAPGEYEDAVATRIASEGTWRYLPGGVREFIPAHQIKRILHGVAAAPVGE